MLSDNIADLELLYSPESWTKRYSSAEECLQDHVRIITEESDIVRSSIPARLDIPYGSLQKEKYDLFGTDLPDASPIFFFVHGGYWQAECVGKNNSSFVAKILYKHGIKSFVTGYELCPKVQFQDVIQQVEKSFRICLDYAKEKGSRGICLMGHSAGGHLIAHLFSHFAKTLLPEELNLLKSAFFIGGVFNLQPLLSTSLNTALKLTPVTAKEFAPINHRMVDCRTKFFVVVGRYDSPAFVEQSEIFERKLRDQKLDASLMILENIDHFNIMEKMTEEDYVLVESVVGTLGK